VRRITPNATFASIEVSGELHKFERIAKTRVPSNDGKIVASLFDMKEWYGCVLSISDDKRFLRKRLNPMKRQNSRPAGMQDQHDTALLFAGFVVT